MLNNEYNYNLGNIYINSTEKSILHYIKRVF